MLEDYYRLYGFVLILSVVAVIVPTSMVLMSWLLQRLRVRPSKPDPVKSEIYECGMETIGGRWVQFNFRYYLYALLFLLFDVTAVFIYPWAVRLKTLGAYALLELLAFVGILTLGWAYAWRKG
ncbi:MAG: NADH-quinone oxidoreductase subunit A, partial [Chloroflexota bacterium]|nr:NADH-quinone oxidoreductase subunit A [Chloroflexota bacterium]